LRRLLRGMEKTAEGELYYMIEAADDEELNILINAFNRMTRTLWNNQRKLREFNARLNKMNLNLIESQLFLATLIDNSPFSVIVASPDGQIMLFNRMASDMFGHINRDAIGKPVAGLFAKPLDSVAENREGVDGSPNFDVRCRRSDGSSFPAYVILTPVYSRGGEVCAFLYIIRDISESTGFQEMMIRLDRYCTRGEMAGDIAHEINNYLAILAGNLDLLPVYMSKGAGEKVDRRLELMRDTVQRIARFADGLMDVPQDKVEPEKADLNQVAENILAFLKPQNRFDNIKFETWLSSELPLIEFDPAQIQQLLMNFVFNAADALEEVSGEKRVKLISRLVTCEGCRYARVEVYDNGPGVPEDKRSILFKQRFTTKRKGHGIGLITCRKMVEAHHGRIGYTYADGSVFHFELPVEQPSQADEPAGVHAEAAVDSRS
jgi:PAS domain S-box-containing protein